VTSLESDEAAFEEGLQPMGQEGGGEGGEDRSFASNAMWMVAGHAIGKIASFVFVLIVTRGLGTVSYGYFNFAASFVPLFLIVGTWGLDIAIMREVAKDRGRLSELLASGLILRLGLGSAAVGLSLGIGVFLTNTHTAYLTLVIVGLSLLLDETTNLVGSVFKSFERMRFFSLALLVNRVLSTLLALGAVMAGAGIVGVSIMYMLGSAGALAVAVFALWRYFPPVRLRDANRPALMELLHHGAPLGLAAAMNMALFRIDAVMLQAIKGAVDVGIYGIAYRFLDSFLFVAYGLGVVAMPRIARQSWSNEAEQGFNAVLALMLAFYIPLGVGGVYLSRWAVVLLFSSQYSSAATAVGWLAASGAFYAIAYLCRFSAVALGRRRQIAYIAAAALTFNIVGNFIAIPRYGYRGAAVLTFASEVLEATLLSVLLVRAAGRRVRLHRLVLSPVLAGVAMALVLTPLHHRGTMAALLSGGVYLAVLAVSAMVVAPAESRRVVSLVRRRR
jgi:O-antigen/teichoic acid export membrane protein